MSVCAPQKDPMNFPVFDKRIGRGMDASNVLLVILLSSACFPYIAIVLQNFLPFMTPQYIP